MNKDRFLRFMALNDVMRYCDFDFADMDIIHKNKICYYNIPCAFDIETTSLYYNGEKCAFMYEWTFGLYGQVTIGRTWNEFFKMIEFLSKRLEICNEKRLVIYVHNLSYEFQFIRKRFEWQKVFSLDRRKPIYAISVNGFEFRCSYLLSGYSLAKLADNIHIIKIKKLVGDLDYNLIRHSGTVMTNNELQYCINDVKIVMAYIAEQIEANKGIIYIPLTKTGFVRRYVRKKCFYSNGDISRYKYGEMIKHLSLNADEYAQLKRAFQGGFTHAGIFTTKQTINNVTSFDFTSSYPTVMISEQFPMSKSKIVDVHNNTELNHYLKNYCCLFDIEFINIRPRKFFENYISRSRCFVCENPVINNGRLVSADRIMTTITEQDYAIIKAFYKWDKKRISQFRIYKRGYLPRDFVISILDLYAQKTELKGVEGKEIEYLNSKELLNSCYGMSVTDPVRDEYMYENEWLDPIKPDTVKAIEKYNKNTNRFLFYPWGVWVTAYARRNLFTGISEFKGDYIYSDTDSIKVTNAEKHMNYINKYNKMIIENLKRAMEYHNIDISRIRPKTIKGVEKPLGIWDFDGHYSKFKTLGAKRYLVQYSDDPRNGDHMGEYSLTVSGLNKKVALPYMLKTFDDVFEAFTNDLYIPPQYTGKNTHTYIDDRKRGEIIDYRGIRGTFDEFSAVHMENADYTLSISQEYADYILSVKETETI